MRLHGVVVAGASAFGLAASAAATAHAVTSRSPTEPGVEIATAGSCSLNSRVNVSPGLTMSPKDFTFTMEGLLGPCKMPNGETRAGRITITRGTGNGGCSSARVETPFTVSWDGGRKASTGQASGITNGPFGVVTGTLDGGDYAGTPFETFIFLNPKGPLQCGTSGITSAELYGQVTFR